MFIQYVAVDREAVDGEERLNERDGQPEAGNYAAGRSDIDLVEESRPGPPNDCLWVLKRMTAGMFHYRNICSLTGKSNFLELLVSAH